MKLTEEEIQEEEKQFRKDSVKSNIKFPVSFNNTLTNIEVGGNVVYEDKPDVIEDKPVSKKKFKEDW